MSSVQSILIPLDLFDTRDQLLLYSYNQVIEIVYMLILRSTVIVRFDPFPHIPLSDMKIEALKRYLDFTRFLLR